MPVVEMRVCDEEPYTIKTDLLGRQDSLREPFQPLRDIQRLLILLKLILVGLPLPLD